jgi:hypothetical protein
VRRAVGLDLLLPDGQFVLHPLDDLAAHVECVGSVRARDGAHDGGVANAERAGAVRHRDAHVVAVAGAGEFGEVRCGVGMRAVLERGHLARGIGVVVAHRADEHRRRTGCGGRDRVEVRRDVEGYGGDVCRDDHS